MNENVSIDDEAVFVAGCSASPAGQYISHALGLVSKKEISRPPGLVETVQATDHLHKEKKSKTEFQIAHVRPSLLIICLLVYLGLWNTSQYRDGGGGGGEDPPQSWYGLQMKT